MSNTIVFTFLVVAVTSFISRCIGADILFALTRPFDSHYECGVRIAEHLRSRGHNITFLVHENQVGQPGVTRHHGLYNFEFATRYWKKEVFNVGVNIFERLAKANVIEHIQITLEILNIISRWWGHELEKVIADAPLLDRIGHAQYDVVVVEGNFVWLIPFAQRNHKHFVTLTTHALHSINAEWFNLPVELSYIPFDNGANVIKYNFKGDRLYFYARVVNFVHLFAKHYYHWLVASKMVEVQNEYNAAPDMWGHDSFGLADVWLTNADFSTDYPRPFAPNMGLVGGLLVRDASPLNEEYQAVYDAAGEAGVLMVSMGSIINNRDQDLVNTMAAAFARLPQKIIWKATDPLPEFVADNIILKEWIPQNDLLAHPNTRAMVYHCGNNGAFESLYHGVPVIGIPIFADQTDVAYRIESGGMGIMLELPLLTEEILFEGISEVINNPRYKAHAKELSAIYRDESAHPAERAAFWIEYVNRHNGTRLLKSKVAFMGFIQQYLLDVWCFFICVGVFLLYTIRKCISRLCSTPSVP